MAKEYHLENEVTLSYTPEGLVMRLSDHALFDLGVADLAAEAMPLLAKIGEIIAKTKYLIPRAAPPDTPIESSSSDQETVTSPDPTGIEKAEALPKNMYLRQNYPNPFNPDTRIEYGLPKASEVRLTLYNILGQKVAELVNKSQNAGRYTVTWQPENVASGLYIYRLSILLNK